jgi:hypothetical protein
MDRRTASLANSQRHHVRAFDFLCSGGPACLSVSRWSGQIRSDHCFLTARTRQNCFLLRPAPQLIAFMHARLPSAWPNACQRASTFLLNPTLLPSPLATLSLHGKKRKKKPSSFLFSQWWSHHAFVQPIQFWR